MPPVIVPTGGALDRACILPYFIKRLRAADPILENEFANRRVYWISRGNDVVFSFREDDLALTATFSFHLFTPHNLWMLAKADADEAYRIAEQRRYGPRIATERDVANWQADDALITKACRQLKCRPDELNDRLDDLLGVIERLRQKKQELERELKANDE